MKHQFGEILGVLTTRTADHDGIAVVELAGEVDMMTAEEPLTTPQFCAVIRRRKQAPAHPASVCLAQER